MTAFDGVHGTVCTAQQYQLSLQSSDSSSPSISCLTPGESIGFVLTAEASLLSCISVVVIFIWICVRPASHSCVYPTFPDRNWKLFKGPADIYMLSLFVFDLLQATGGILNIRWAHNGIVTTGPYCTAQGLVEQIGDLGVALITLLLAVHTFVAAVLPGDLRGRGVALSLVCLACVFIILWVAIGASVHKNYETPTPYWCWISPRYPGERLGGEYIWMWIALSVSAVLYTALYFWAEGFWSINEEYQFCWADPDQRVGYTQRRATLGMLLYPLAYSLVVLPISISRWLLFTHHHVSSAATFFANSMFYLSGAINVLLFLIIRPELLLFRRPEELAEPEIELAPQGTGPAIVSDTEKFQHSPEPTSAALGDGGPRDSATPYDDNSKQIPDEIDV
ncbi:hypothetical protein F5888DRAFT_1918898 [Russula emetica]|nr:hypothetical protein F5888DRAFT_1918898 [Russula emetica]